MKHTPLHAAHQKLGAKLIEFGGWEMPVYYTSILDEHQAVRTGAGLFDISHMGEFHVRGKAARDFLNNVLTNDVRKLTPGLGQYTLLCNERGGTVDDLYLYQLYEDDFLLIVNAARIDADWQWLQQCLSQFPQRCEVEMRNGSDNFGAVALQGPKSSTFIDGCFESTTRKPSSLQKNEIVEGRFGGQPVFVSRTGYTGEDGFEIVAPAGVMEALWNKILEAGKSADIKPAGLGARDTLRTEACYPLYGHELDENTSPIEAGLGFFIALDKGDFMGRAILAGQKSAGPAKKLIAFQTVGRCAPPRPQYPILNEAGSRIGEITSGTQSPSLNLGIGLGYVASPGPAVNTPIAIEVRGKAWPAVVVKKPFYRKSAPSA